MECLKKALDRILSEDQLIRIGIFYVMLFIIFLVLGMLWMLGMIVLSFFSEVLTTGWLVLGIFILYILLIWVVGVWKKYLIEKRDLREAITLKDENFPHLFIHLTLLFLVAIVLGFVLSLAILFPFYIIIENETYLTIINGLVGGVIQIILYMTLAPASIFIIIYQHPVVESLKKALRFTKEHILEMGIVSLLNMVPFIGVINSLIVAYMVEEC